MTAAIPVEAFMAGVGIGLTVTFVGVLLTIGANIIRRMTGE
jgi:hypothetical protein